MKRNILVFTSSRADFGHLQGVIEELVATAEVTLLVTGAHTLSEGRSSIEEVLNFCDRHKLNHQIVPIVGLTPNDGIAQINSLSELTPQLAHKIQCLSPELIILLGDRWELFSISVAALLMRVPLAHISGGEVTTGAIDDCVRHAHTKLAHLHFAASESNARTISLLGEEDWRITISGESGLDWVHSSIIPEYSMVCTRFGLSEFPSRPLLLFTYHPTSYGDQLQLIAELDVLINAFNVLKDFEILITGPGSEQGSDQVRNAFQILSSTESHVLYVEHLGCANYLALMKGAAAVVGNSSSGIVEAPSLGTPSVDIGDRQLGRGRADSTLHCSFSVEELVNAVRVATSVEFREFAKQVINPYDPYRDGQNCRRIAQSCIHALDEIGKEQILAKGFDQICDSSSWNFLLTAS